MDEAERTHTLVEDYWDSLLDLDPLLGTFSGDPATTTVCRTRARPAVRRAGR